MIHNFFFLLYFLTVNKVNIVSLNKVKIIGDYKKFENSEYLSERILCLPMYGSLSESMIKKIARIINASS